MSVPDCVMQPLPSGPSTLSFSKDEFMKEEFHFEQFIVECRRRVPMETLRDDLSIYLKILQSAMIELINKDYADFVNLSTNLVGMDKAINNLISPLEQLREEVFNVQGAMDEAIANIEEKLSQKSLIRQKKQNLQRLMNIVNSVEKIEKLLGIYSCDSSEDNLGRLHTGGLNGQLIERVATEFNKLQFYVNKSRGLPLVEDIKPRIANITTTLQFSLEGSFKDGLESNNVEILQQCLRTYATIDKMRDAEGLFRQFIVKPYMEEVITEHFIRNHPDGMNGMYGEILDFVPKHCKSLKDVTSGKGQGGDVVRGYDFLVNSVWPEVVSNIEARTPSIFAPGNPNIFHEKYTTSMEFVVKFEKLCGSQSSVKRFRAHPSYNTYMTKWSLPVYYQIRFQEIAGGFEESISSPFESTADESSFHLIITENLWLSLHACWTKEIYLQPLCHRFWKLTLQMSARYSSWIADLIENQLQKKSEPETSSLRRVETVSSFGGHQRSSSDGPIGGGHQRTGSTGKAGVGDHAGEHAPDRSANPPLTNGQIVRVIADMEVLNVKIPGFYREIVRPQIVQLGVQNLSLFDESITESLGAVLNLIPKFSAHLIEDISSQSSVHLKTVNDIPRLYRRTNRDVPTKASSYVTNVMKALNVFVEEYNEFISSEYKDVWMKGVLSVLTEQYYTVTNDVLTSVKKMEESLKRLKKRGGGGGGAGQGMSDDDKIRLQLYLDVCEFGSQIKSLGLIPSEIEAFNKLVTLVDSAKLASNNGNGN